MPYHAAIHFCDEGYRKGIGSAQRLDDELLCVVLIARVLNAAIVTSVIELTSSSLSFLITIFKFIRFVFLLLAGQQLICQIGFSRAFADACFISAKLGREYIWQNQVSHK